MQIVIDIDSYILEHCKRHVREHYANNIEEAIANGVPLLKGQFIAICDSDYPITEKVENTLKETAFVGGDEEEEDMYCFDIKEIIKADKE